MNEWMNEWMKYLSPLPNLVMMIILIKHLICMSCKCNAILCCREENVLSESQIVFQAPRHFCEIKKTHHCIYLDPENWMIKKKDRQKVINIGQWVSVSMKEFSLDIRCIISRIHLKNLSGSQVNFVTDLLKCMGIFVSSFVICCSSNTIYFKP